MERRPSAPALDRRSVLGGAVGVAIGTARSSPALAQSRPDIAVVILSDLHSAYERAAQTLAAVDNALARHSGIPALIVINGDIFERGNPIALRSDGALDWAFLAALRRKAPVVVNLGNHETALVDDMAAVVRRLQEHDLTVVSNLTDRRTNRPFVPATASVDVRGVPATLVGIATDEIDTYRMPVRPTLDISPPAAWGVRHVPEALAAGRANIVLSHAGVVADRAILPVLRPGSLLVGGHEHLAFNHMAGGSTYVHTGSWNRTVTVATLGAINSGTPTIALERLPIGLEGPADAAFATQIAEVRRAHTTDEERVVVATSRQARDLGETGRFIAGAIAQAAGADVGAISHTTLGTGLPAGPIDRATMASIVRFDGGLVVAEVDGSALAAIQARANQDRDTPLDQRVGDFVYMNDITVDPGRRYRLATIGWVRLNAARYLGRADFTFAPVTTPQIRAILASALGS